MHIYHYQAGPALTCWDHKVFIGFGCIFGLSSPSPFLCPGVHCSVLFSSLSYVSVWKIRSYRKVVKTSTSIFQTLCLFFNLFAYLVYSYCACETVNLFHGTTTALCPPFGICGQPPWIVLCLPMGQKNSRSGVHIRTPLTSFNSFILWPTHWVTLWRRSPLNSMIISVWIYWHNWAWVTVSDVFQTVCVSGYIFSITWVFASSSKFPFENSLTLQMKLFHSLKLIFSLVCFKFTELLKFSVLSSAVLEVRGPAAQSVRPSM